MGIFENKFEKQVQYLEEERKKIWNRLEKAEDLIKKNTSDYEKDAMQASRKTSEFRNRSEEAKETALEYLKEIKSYRDTSEGLRNAINSSYESSQTLHSEMTTFHDSTKENLNQTIEKTKTIDSAYENYDDLLEKLEKLESIFESSDETSTKTEAIYANITSRKKEIDRLYYEIIGYTEKDKDTGETTEVIGLKDELETAYEDLTNNIKELNEKIISIDEISTKNYKDFSQEKETSFEMLIMQWNENYSKLKDEIERLLPNALTAGLSHAYSEKKDAEETEIINLSQRFNKSIYGMLAISIIPFLISLVSIYQGKTLEESLLDMPRLVLCILPLYIPVFWVAYSSNKKINLSKRLAEEYTHKEVLSKTFEGLSRQIENIDNQDITSELRTKLLYNILEVSSENPGKLISDYNKADHPLMDALDKSIQLSNAVNKLSNVPGLTKMSEILDNKAKNILKAEGKKAEQALESIKEEEEEVKVVTTAA